MKRFVHSNEIILGLGFGWKLPEAVIKLFKFIVPERAPLSQLKSSWQVQCYNDIVAEAYECRFIIV